MPPLTRSGGGTEVYTPVFWHCKPKRLDPPSVPSSVQSWPQVCHTLAGNTVFLSLVLFHKRLEESHGDQQNTTCVAPIKLNNFILTHSQC